MIDPISPTIRIIALEHELEDLKFRFNQMLDVMQQMADEAKADGYMSIPPSGASLAARIVNVVRNGNQE